MTEALPLVAGLICFVLLIFLSQKSRKEKADTTPSKVKETTPVIPVSPPPLPPRTNKAPLSARPAQLVLDYPKCPIDRCRNEPGKPQVVFWDSAKKCYTCCHGHHFTGRE